MRHLRFVFGLMLLMPTQILFGQTDDCEQTLTTALDEFNAGHFYGLSAILKPCIDNGFTLEQQQRAYLLLAQTYLLIDDPIGAEDSYLKLLKANPEFVTDEARDPIDVVYLSKKFTAAPIFSLFGRVGGNISIARVIHDIDLFDVANGTGPTPSRQGPCVRALRRGHGQPGSWPGAACAR
jgi:hypothetical protein